jgi:hypothetical protein
MKLVRREAKDVTLFRLSIVMHVAAWIVAGVAVVGAVLLLLWVSFDKPQLQSLSRSGIGPGALFDSAKLALTVVAGIGGVVGLVVAFRRQRLNEAEHERQERATARDETRLFTERFAQATQQLGSDQAAVRVAGVYALAGLADDWPAGRQSCVDVLCAYLRMPFRLRAHLPEYTPVDDSGKRRFSALRTELETPGLGRMSYPPNEEHQVRSTVISAMKDRMFEHATVQWSGLSLDFSGAVFDEVSFDGFIFDGCDVDFGNCVFVGDASFAQSKILGSSLWFTGAVHLGRMGFELAHFEDSEVTFYGDFGEEGDINLQSCTVQSGRIALLGPRNGNGSISFVTARLEGGVIEVSGPQMSDGTSIAFSRATISGTSIVIHDGTYEGGNFWFNGIKLCGGYIAIKPRYPQLRGKERMTLAGTEIAFDGVEIESGSIRFGFLDVDGSEVHFDDLDMTGGAIRFVDVTLKSGSIRMNDPTVSAGSIDLGELGSTPAGRDIASQVGEFLGPVAPVGDQGAD